LTALYKGFGESLFFYILACNLLGPTTLLFTFLFFQHTDQLWRQMRWLEEAIQTGRDQQATSDRLLSVATVTRNVERQRTEAEERKKKKEEGTV